MAAVRLILGELTDDTLHLGDITEDIQVTMLETIDIMLYEMNDGQWTSDINHPNLKAT